MNIKQNSKKNIKINKEKLDKNIGTCDCGEIGYLWDHENGDEYMVCPFHFMEGLHAELDSTIRDYLPIGQWSQKEQDLIDEIREGVNGFLRFNMDRYYYYLKKEKEKDKSWVK